MACTIIRMQYPQGQVLLDSIKCIFKERFPILWSTSQVAPAASAKLVQSQMPGSPSGLPWEFRGPRIWASLCCLLRPLLGSWIQSDAARSCTYTQLMQSLVNKGAGPLQIEILNLGNIVIQECCSRPYFQYRWPIRPWRLYWVTRYFLKIQVPVSL